MWKFSRKTALRAGVVALVAAVTPVLASPSAQAITWDHTLHTDDGDPGGRLQFEAYGDIVRICDIEADGWAVGVQIIRKVAWDNSYTFQVGGNGNCAERRASQGYPFDMTEGHQYEFTVFLAKDGGRAYHDVATWTA
ncbi:hypothetical protein [Streptomyces sp. RFCAC02]|uniref:hypothetical protein n=1 Tax=Streptomyces sp. RFCAC02 TaxID=2499143 RepID=UPI00101EE0E2|nr:hypothetical protein [Streptomyces sp. RFCAC02]